MVRASHVVDDVLGAFAIASARSEEELRLRYLELAFRAYERGDMGSARRWMRAVVLCGGES